MGRPRQYDRATVLRNARDLFWQKGYAATSIDDLLRAMKLNRGSLYSAFGSKRNLFFEAFRNYDEEIIDPPLLAMGRAEAPLEGVRNYLVSLVDRSVEDQERCGSLLTNTVTELANVDDEVLKDAVRVLEKIEAAFANAVRRAQAKGDLPAGLSVPGAAMLLVGICQAIHVLGKARPERPMLLGIVDLGLASLHT